MIVAVSGVVAEFPQDVIERIAQGFSPEKIILFGSRARGTADEGSDFDLLVLFDEVADPNRRSAELHAALGDFPYAADIVVSTIQASSGTGMW